MNNLKYKAILFDKDGTFTNSIKVIVDSFKYAMKEVLHVDNIDEQRYKSYIGLVLNDQFKHYTDDQNVRNKLLQVYRKYNKAHYDKEATNYDGVPEVLRSIKDMGYFMGVVTSSRRELTEHSIKMQNLDGIFDYILSCSDYSEAHKPDPRVLIYACNQLNLEPSSVLYVGDSVHDMKCAIGAGCSTAAVLWGAGTLEALKKENPDYILEKPSELLEILK